MTAWAGDTVIINCTVHTENNSSAVIIWLREQDNRSEVVAHHDKILLTEEEDDAKFQVLVSSELSERSVVVSQLSVSPDCPCHHVLVSHFRYKTAVWRTLPPSYVSSLTPSLDRPWTQPAPCSSYLIK